MAAGGLVWIGAALAAAGVGALRLAWGLPQRSVGWNTAGWALIAAGIVAGGAGAGAWGVAVTSLFAMGAALVALTVAAAGSPPGRATASNRRAGMLPQGGEPGAIGRRVATFLIVMVLAWIVATGLAVALRGLAAAAGLVEADANVLALFAAPLLWGVLACVLLMQSSRRAQLTTLALCCVPVIPALTMGVG